MIGRIQGVLAEIVDNLALLDVGGVGYEVELTSAAIAALAGVGSDASFYTHHVVREDAQLLYGFGSREERDLFRELIKISGVGPKLGVALLSSLSLSDLAHAVRARDAGALTRVPGVGKKTAERLLVDLKDKLDGLNVVTPLPAASGVAASDREAVDALIALGYKEAEALNALQLIEGDGWSTEELVRKALQGFVRSRSAAS